MNSGELFFIKLKQCFLLKISNWGRVSVFFFSQINFFTFDLVPIAKGLVKG